jgi:hypothetical protein
MLRQRGHEMGGIRLDSGDLAYLSIEARRLLDAAGFPKAKILASNDLDEYLVADLKQQGAKVGIWGIGTKLVTACDQPALGGVYKMGALRAKDGKAWEHKIKLSEQVAKTSIPGILQVRRFRDDRGFVADAIYDTITGIDADGAATTIIDPNDMTRQKKIAAGTAHEDLLVPVFRDGKCVYNQPSITEVRERATHQLAMLHPSIKRFTNPHRYPAGLEKNLFELRTALILKARELHEEQRALEAAGAEPAALPAPAAGAEPAAAEVEAEEPQHVMEDPTEFPVEVAAEPEPAPAAPEPPPAPAPGKPGPPKVTVPVRPKFAGIGAKHGQPISGSTVRVNVRRAGERPTPKRDTPGPKPFFFGGSGGGGNAGGGAGGGKR